ncbi:MAG TPA: hypothetical protein VF185_04820 [Patescibacteria group bacterium]
MIIEEVESKFNGKLSVERDIAWGVHIRAGGLTQTGGIVNDVWKKTLRVLKEGKPSINNCLILGLGGGSVAHELVKLWPWIEIKGVDIDETIVNLGKKYLGLEKSNVFIVIGDASKFIGKEKKKYDLICVDMYKGEDVPEEFTTEAFIKKVKKLLTKDGVAVFNRLYGPDDRTLSMEFGRKLDKVFGKTEYVYPQANVMFVCYNRG